MRKQIEQVVDRFGSLSKEKKEKVKKILKKYVNGEIEINKAYELLVDADLIRTLRDFSPEEISAEDEERLKQYIRNKIFHISE